MNKKIPNEFQIQLFGEPFSVSPVLSKMRARIFYKYENRNGAYITDEFADKLLKTIAYTPVKGIYTEDDFSDHGESRDLGRIYGVVPEQYNLTWEEHQDSDGVIRTYATVDVYIYSALYKEAQEIQNKALSMEIYAPSIKGKWKKKGSYEFFEYTEGCFLGLQVLGETVEPCFEGAGFFSLKEQFSEILQQYAKQKNAGGTKMDFNMIELPNAALGKTLYDLLNEEDKKFCIMDINEEDSKCFAYDFVNKNYVEIFYKKKEDGTCSIEQQVILRPTFYSDAENQIIAALKEANGGSFENFENNFVKKAEAEEKINGLNSKIAELESNCAIAVNDLATAKQELDSLKSYKLSIENAQKKELINKYSAILSQDVIEEFNQSIDKFSLIDLEKELAFSYMKNGAVFNKTPDNYTLIPKPEPQKSGIEAILDNFKN